MSISARNAIVVILASVLAAVLIYYGHTPFTQTRPVPGGLPEFGFPSFTLTYNTSSNATITWGPVDILSVSDYPADTRRNNSVIIMSKDLVLK